MHSISLFERVALKAEYPEEAIYKYAAPSRCQGLPCQGYLCRVGSLENEEKGEAGASPYVLLFSNRSILLRNHGVAITG